MMKTVDLLDVDGVMAFSTERDCCNHQSPHDGFSACGYVPGADFAKVTDCRLQLAAKCGVAPDRLIFPVQTHSDNVVVVDQSNIVTAFNGVDGLVTALPDVALGINTADCAAVVLADVVGGVIGVCHSGWRGTVADIAGKTVGAMVATGASRNRIVAALGPMICLGCFEVGREVSQHFADAFVVTAGYDKPHVDLAAVIRSQLEAAGVAGDAIAGPIGCSRCEWQRFFSARRLGVASGRTATVVVRHRPPC